MWFPGDSVVKNSAANEGGTGDVGLIPAWEDSLEEKMAIHSSILAWKISWTEEPGGGAILHGVSKSWTQL